MKTEHYQTIEVSKNQQVITVALNRPDKKNAMSFAMMRELLHLAGNLKKQRSIRAVILTGAGEDFCAGIDLSDLNQPKEQAFALWELIKPCQSLFQRVCLVWRYLPMPVIAVINGHCLGAGLQLVMACDIRIATADSKFAIMEAKWGLVPDMGITQSALGVVTADVLKELAMTARMIEGSAAKELGIISHLSDEPMSQAESLIAEIEARSPDAVLASKRVINRMYKQSVCTLYQEKLWQTKLLLGHNRKLAMKKAKDSSVKFIKRQFS